MMLISLQFADSTNWLTEWKVLLQKKKKNTFQICSIGAVTRLVSLCFYNLSIDRSPGNLDQWFSNLSWGPPSPDSTHQLVSRGCKTGIGCLIRETYKMCRAGGPPRQGSTVFWVWEAEEAWKYQNWKMLECKVININQKYILFIGLKICLFILLITL